jgi:hypothetical protein
LADDADRHTVVPGGADAVAITPGAISPRKPIEEIGELPDV